MKKGKFRDEKRELGILLKYVTVKIKYWKTEFKKYLQKHTAKKQNITNEMGILRDSCRISNIHITF